VNEARILLQAVFVTPEIDRPTDARRGQKAKLTGTPSGAATRSSAGHAAAAVCPAAFGRSQLGTHRDAGRHRPQLGEQVGGHHQPSASVPGACNDAGPTETTVVPTSGVTPAGDSTLKSRARKVYKVNALEHTGAPCR